MRMSRELQELEPVSDVVQSAMREVLARGSNRDASLTESRLRARLYQAAWRKIVDRFRLHRTRKRNAGPARQTGRRQSGSSLVDGAPAPDLQLIQRERIEILGRAVEELQPLQQQVLRWFYEDGLSHAEIGRRIRRSEDATKMLVRRAVARLGVALGKDR